MNAKHELSDDAIARTIVRIGAKVRYVSEPRGSAAVWTIETIVCLGVLAALCFWYVALA